MAKIRNRRLTQSVIDELGLQRNWEKVPDELASKVVPVFEVAEKGVQQVLRDATLNDSDKSFVVPAGQKWKIDSIYADLATTATVGNRRLAIDILDTDGNIVWRTINTGAHSANTTIHYLAQGDAYFVGVITLSGLNPMFKGFVKEGWTIQIHEEQNVDATGDDLIVNIIYRSFMERGE